MITKHDDIIIRRRKQQLTSSVFCALKANKAFTANFPVLFCCSIIWNEISLLDKFIIKTKQKIIQ